MRRKTDNSAASAATNVSNSTPSFEDVIARHAARQHGLITRTQLLTAGIPSEVVQRRISARRLRRVHRGVYLTSSHMTGRARELAAVLACGIGAALSHLSAAVLWALIRGRSDRDPVDVSVHDRVRGRRPGIRAHRMRRLDADEVTTLEGVPVTTPARTLIDIASVMSGRELEQALATAYRRHLTSRSRLVALLARAPARHGTGMLLTLLNAETEPAFARSEAEQRFLTLLREAQLPMPGTNVDVAGYQVDFLWRPERLVVEVDGFDYHSSPDRFESDRRRDARLTATGLRVIRVTWQQIANEPMATITGIAQALVAARFR